jgi:GNAT superfamily N-acetyltransferase
MSALLGAGPSAAARFVRQARTAGVSLDHIWCLVDDRDRYRAAVLSVASPGRAAMLLASHPRDVDDAERIGGIVARASEGSAPFADIAQALVDPSRPLDVVSFERGGLRRMANLDYLERGLPRAGVLDAPRPPEGWSIEPVAPAHILGGADPHALPASLRDEICATLERSYVDTLDCPGLAGMRKTQDVLDGHFGTGARTRHWLAAREGAAMRGVCLLNVGADGSSAELVYLGLAPEARGRGIASVLLAHGMHACSRSRCASITLAVDARNTHAARLYDTNGFRKVSSRVALVRPTRA